ncbi:toll/interleukin-1 receptor domain-containing protein [Variovorax sp. YR752]|uniref:toll/interleukin-1 receptor domain-containing protein n=1 Tax=Variovorax sp. YR752 TaxID=1884383 RepID=UPI0031377498
MTDIFLSYRRQDSSSATGRLADRLEEHFGPGRVFRDHQSLNPGEDFTEAIRRAVSTSTVMLAIIGPDWLTAQGSDGKRRLDQPTDFVRQEIETALQAHVPVIPVLVEGAQMPARETLPKSIGELWRINAMELSESRWHFDTDTLMRTLQTRYVIESERPAMGDMPGQTPLFGSGARFALSLLELATHPTRMIAKQQTGQAIDHVRALVFLLGSLAVGSLLVLLGFQLQADSSSIGELARRFVGGTLGLVLAGLVLTTLLSVALMLAWRLAGRRIELQQVTLIMAYLVSGAWLGTAGGALVFGFGASFYDPGWFGSFAEAIGFSRLAPQTGGDALAGTLGLKAIPAVAGLGTGALTWLMTVLWCIVAWGAFRHAFGVTRPRAAVATLAWLLLLGSVLALGGGVAWQLSKESARAAMHDQTLST